MNITSKSSGIMMITFLIIVTAATMSFAQMGGGKGPGGNNGEQYFDANTVITISGTLDEFLGLWSANGPGDCTGAGLHFTITSGGNTYYAMFGPFFFLEDNGIELADGMKVTITGSVVPPHNEDFQDNDYIIVTEVTAGGKTLELRDENGLPMWAGSNKGGKGKGLYYNCPNYNTSTTSSVAGEVLQVRTRTGGANADAGVQLMIRTKEGARMRVYVAPQYFCEANGFSVAKGDQVKVRGSLQKRNMVSSSVTCNGESLQTRDRKGNPRWVTGS